MKKYQKRGIGMLAVFLCACAVGLIMCFFENTRDLGIGMLVFAALFYLPMFLYYRRLTPAQFEAEQKQERIANDERNQKIGGRTSSIVVLLMMVSLAAGAVVALIAGDRSAVYANVGQIAILFISVLIVNSILKKKM